MCHLVVWSKQHRGTKGSVGHLHVEGELYGWMNIIQIS